VRLLRGEPSSADADAPATTSNRNSQSQTSRFERAKLRQISGAFDFRRSIELKRSRATAIAYRFKSGLFSPWMLKLRVRVKPNARRSSIEEQADGSLTVSVNAPPTGGRANEVLIRLIADRFDVPKSRVRIRLGLSSRNKVVEIE